jgi:hypothetical protein
MEESLGKAFLRDVLLLEGVTPTEIRASVGRDLAEYERQARAGEPEKRMKDKAAQACRALCRSAVVEEMVGQIGSTAEHLKLVLSVIDEPSRYPVKD